jgi:uncharacterized protein YoxC
MLSAPALIGLVNLILIVLVALINHLNHIKLTTNELKHLTDDVKTIISRQEGISEKVNILATDLAFLKGKFDIYTSKKIFKKSKKILNKV